MLIKDVIGQRTSLAECKVHMKSVFLCPCFGYCVEAVPCEEMESFGDIKFESLPEICDLIPESNEDISSLLIENSPELPELPSVSQIVGESLCRPCRVVLRRLEPHEVPAPPPLVASSSWRLEEKLLRKRRLFEKYKLSRQRKRRAPPSEPADAPARMKRKGGRRKRPAYEEDGDWCPRDDGPPPAGYRTRVERATKMLRNARRNIIDSASSSDSEEPPGLFYGEEAETTECRDILSQIMRSMDDMNGGAAHSATGRRSERAPEPSGPEGRRRRGRPRGLKVAPPNPDSVSGVMQDIVNLVCSSAGGGDDSRTRTPDASSEKETKKVVVCRHCDSPFLLPDGPGPGERLCVICRDLARGGGRRRKGAAPGRHKKPSPKVRSRVQDRLLKTVPKRDMQRLLYADKTDAGKGYNHCRGTADNHEPRPPAAPAGVKAPRGPRKTAAPRAVDANHGKTECASKDGALEPEKCAKSRDVPARNRVSMTDVGRGLFLMTFPEPDRELDMKGHLSRLSSSKREVKLAPKAASESNPSSSDVSSEVTTTTAAANAPEYGNYIMPPVPTVVVANYSADAKKGDYYLSSVFYQNDSTAPAARPGLVQKPALQMSVAPVQRPRLPLTVTTTTPVAPSLHGSLLAGPSVRPTTVMFHQPVSNASHLIITPSNTVCRVTNALSTAGVVSPLNSCFSTAALSAGVVSAPSAGFSTAALSAGLLGGPNAGFSTAALSAPNAALTTALVQNGPVTLVANHPRPPEPVREVPACNNSALQIRITSVESERPWDQTKPPAAAPPETYLSAETGEFLPKRSCLRDQLMDSSTQSAGSAPEIPHATAPGLGGAGKEQTKPKSGVPPARVHNSSDAQPRESKPAAPPAGENGPGGCPKASSFSAVYEEIEAIGVLAVLDLERNPGLMLNMRLERARDVLQRARGGGPGDNVANLEFQYRILENAHRLMRQYGSFGRVSDHFLGKDDLVKIKKEVLDEEEEEEEEGQGRSRRSACAYAPRSSPLPPAAAPSPCARGTAAGPLERLQTQIASISSGQPEFEPSSLLHHLPSAPVTPRLDPAESRMTPSRGSSGGPRTPARPESAASSLGGGEEAPLAQVKQEKFEAAAAPPSQCAYAAPGPGQQQQAAPPAAPMMVMMNSPLGAIAGMGNGFSPHPQQQPVHHYSPVARDIPPNRTAPFDSGQNLARALLTMKPQPPPLSVQQVYLPRGGTPGSGSLLFKGAHSGAQTMYPVLSGAANQQVYGQQQGSYGQQQQQQLYYATPQGGSPSSYLVQQNKPPVVVSAQQETDQMFCAVCNKVATLRCKQCAKVAYCNTSCAKTYWHKRHKMECRSSAAASEL